MSRLPSSSTRPADARDRVGDHPNRHGTSDGLRDEADADAPVGGGILLFEAAHDDVRRALRLWDTDAGFEASEGGQAAGGPAV